jgi:6-phosphofructokinase 1
MRLVHHRRFGEMVTFDPPQIGSVLIRDAISKLRTVDPDCSAVQAARALGISFGDCPSDVSPFGSPCSSEEITPGAVEHAPEAVHAANGLAAHA